MLTLEKRDYLFGTQFSVADAYLFTVLRWTKYFAIDLNQWPVIIKYMERVALRPGVKAALAAETAAAEN